MRCLVFDQYTLNLQNDRFPRVPIVELYGDVRTDFSAEQHTLEFGGLVELADWRRNEDHILDRGGNVFRHPVIIPPLESLL